MISLDESRGVRTRGVPSKFAFYLPPHYSSEVRKFEDGESPTRNIWHLEEIINFVFPEKYQPTYHQIALKFLNYLTKHGKISGHEIAAFVKDNNISKATFYNRVLPKLKRVGMIKVSRETIVADKSKQKHRPMFITISKTFGNYLLKIADSWLAFVDDVRTKKERKEDNVE